MFRNIIIYKNGNWYSMFSELDFFLFSISPTVHSTTDENSKRKQDNIQITLRSDDTTVNKRKITIRT